MEKIKAITKKYKQELAKHNLFLNIDAQLIEEILQNATIKEFPAGKYITCQGEECNYIYFIYKGYLQSFIGENNGNEAIVNLYKTGNICAEESLFIKNNGYFPHNIVTLKKSVLIALHKYDLKKYLSKNITLTNNLLYIIGQKNIKTQKRLESILVKTPLERIGTYILENSKENTIDFHFNKSVIASYLGMSPETFSRNYSKLKEVFSISAENNRVRIQNPDAMCVFCNLDFIHKCSRKNKKQLQE